MSNESLPYAEIGVRSAIFEIHQSEMSSVFYAETTDRDLVVVKALHQDADDFLKERFAVEAKILGALDHPQIPTLVEDDTGFSKLPNYKMEPVERNRESRRHILQLLHSPDPRVAAEVIHSALSPLGYMHQENFLHRDVKPTNLILGRSAVVLADFGVAVPRPYNRRIESGEMKEGSQEHIAARDHALTYSANGIGKNKRLIGSVKYLSPEEVGGEEIDFTSDIYNVGTSLYELVYGRKAHTGAVGPSEEPSAGLAGRNRLKPKPIPKSRIEEKIDFTVPAGREVPRRLIEIIQKATQRNPDDRYQSTEEMQEDLARYLHS